MSASSEPRLSPRVILAAAVALFASPCLTRCAPPVKTEATSPSPSLSLTPPQPASPPAASAAPRPTETSPVARPVDDPKACVDAPDPGQAPNETWGREVDQRVEAELPKLQNCAAGLSAQGTVAVTIHLGFQRDGAPRSQLVIESTLRDCQVAECLKRGLAKLRAPVSESRVEPAHGVTLALERGAPPRLLDAAATGKAYADFHGQRETTCHDVKLLGRLDPAHIQEVIRSRYDKLRQCYEGALARNPKAEGRVVVRFVIGRDGTVGHARVPENSLPDCAAVRCMVDEYRGLTFNPPDGGIVTVVYPVKFAPE